MLAAAVVQWVVLPFRPALAAMVEQEAVGPLALVDQAALRVLVANLGLDLEEADQMVQPDQLVELVDQV
jgi:hypothetical protein